VSFLIKVRHAVLPYLRRAALFLVRLVPFLRPSLHRLGQIAGTDKVAPIHTHNGLSNAQVYEKYLREWRGRRFSLLEIGVYNGASLRMWRGYLRKAKVVGLDIDPRIERYAREGFEMIIGSQTDTELLDRAIKHDTRFVIDDASHVNELTIKTFEYVFPKLQAGSIYVIEDTHSCYEAALWTWPGMQYNDQDLSLENKREDFDTFLAGLFEDCDLHGHERTVAYVHVWPDTIVIGRA
jgi:hypothetical protein